MTTGDDAPENIGDRLVLIETAIAYLVARQSDVEQLSDATDRLSDSASGLNDALRAIGEVKDKVEEVVEPKVAALEKAAVPKSRLWLTILVVAALVAAAVFSVIDRQRIHDEVHHNHQLICQVEPDKC